jgi:hypothetical protein
VTLLHRLFGQHQPDPDANHWEKGHFVSRCSICGCAMARLPGLPWRKLAEQDAAEGR